MLIMLYAHITLEIGYKMFIASFAKDIDELILHVFSTVASIIGSSAVFVAEYFSNHVRYFAF